MGWKELYNERKMTAEQAVGLIKSGDRISIGHACGEPSYLVDAVMARAEDYHDVEIVHMIAMGKSEYCKPEMAARFHHNSFFVSVNSRDCVNRGQGDFTPSFFFEIPQLFRTTLPLDVAMVMVSPPNEYGMVSLGISVDYSYEAVKTAKTVIAQVNDQMPFTYGALLSVDEFDAFVEHSAPLIELQPSKIGEVEQAIGKYCATLINDGDTLQLGIGAIPDAVLMFLKDKKDLGIHTEMFSDGVVDLVREGVINNRCKNYHNGKFVATFLMGTRKLYDFVDNNPNVEMLPVSQVNHPVYAARNDNLVSINSCVQIDLTGQICSESVGAKQISGIGGQVDFIRSAALSNGGRSIIAIPSTAAQGTISKIVARLDDDAVVTTSRTDVDYVITEYGIAHLKGHTLRERARALIEIAHPDFRASLWDEFYRRFPAQAG